MLSRIGGSLGTMHSIFTNTEAHFLLTYGQAQTDLTVSDYRFTFPHKEMTRWSMALFNFVIPREALEAKAGAAVAVADG